MKAKIFLGSLIIMAGAYLTAHPWIKAARYEHSKQKLLTQWELMAASGGAQISKPTDHPVIESETDTMTDILGDPENADISEVWEEASNPVFDMAYTLEHMEGVIKIEKINLYAPILTGATQYNLDLAVCTITGSPDMGRQGNYCIAGHKSRIYGRHFNRLGELASGDLVVISDGTAEYIFTVTQILRVLPEDTWVLADTEGKSELTLITCDYSVSPVGRYIVRCEPAEPIQ